MRIFKGVNLLAKIMIGKKCGLKMFHCKNARISNLQKKLKLFNETIWDNLVKFDKQ